ncbi:AMP-binding protein [Noviherbaspirillum aerium]|uniref:AMP-binding protein n=1 Tax=Noviherbaspirillum aerium TaxID=2588497 RepID=UPI00178C53A0|nr:AMP-binding protein [Noviherbaspirillum aerium]
MEHASFHGAIQARARARPAHPAYVAPARTWTYADVDTTANRLANALRALGIQPGERVACLTRHIAECTILVLAANKIGAVYHGEARFMMADADFLPVLAPLELPRLLAVVGTQAAPGAEGMEGWCAASPDSDPGHSAASGDTALQLYSPATTGLPKGVELSHRNRIGVCETIGSAYGYSLSETVTFNAAPTFHIGGLGMSFVALYAGSMTVSHPEFDPPRVIEALSRHRVTHTFMVPAMIHLLLQVPGVDQADFSSLRVMGYGAAPITETVLTEAMRIFKCDFIQNYGLTETTGTIVAQLPEDDDPGGPRAHLLRAAGKPCPGTGLRIVDAAGRDLPEGEIGEVWIRAPQNMIGYWRNEKATREAYPEGKQDGIGWFRSGDAGYLRDGYLYIKDMIISGGENIYPVEVENVVVQHPAVLDCAVIAVPDDKWGECVKACIVLRPGMQGQAKEQDIIDFCRERLAHYKCPRSIDFMEALPRSRRSPAPAGVFSRGQPVADHRTDMPRRRRKRVMSFRRRQCPGAECAP